MMKFTKWLEIREMNTMNSGGPNMPAIPNPLLKKPQIKKKDTTVDNVRSILMKAKDPKMAVKQVAQVYDTKMSKSTDPKEIAQTAAVKSSTLSALQGK